MIAYLVEMFGMSLVLTLIVELIILFLFLRFSHFHISMKSDSAQRLGAGEASLKVRRPKAALSESSLSEPSLLASRIHTANPMLLVILVNILTNPPAVLLCWLGNLFLPQFFRIPVQVAVEIVVVFTEAYVYRSFGGKPQWRIEKPVALAVTANLCSWLLGVLLCV